MVKIRLLMNLLFVGVFSLVLIACGPQSAQRAGQGAALGGVSGAAASMVTALIWGGNVGEAAARGAVWGATSGAVSGAIVGSQEDKRASEQQRAEAEKQLKAKLGEDGFAGLSALARCKHKVAVSYAQTAQESGNDAYVVGGLWLEVLSYIDQGDSASAEALYPALIEADEHCRTTADVEERAAGAVEGLQNIRKEYKLPQCS